MQNGIKMMIMYVFLGFLVTIIIFFIIPFSKLKLDFEKDVLKCKEQLQMKSDIFTQKDIDLLPKPVQRYFHYCGYLGTKKMYMMKGIHKNAFFSTGVNKMSLKIKYTQVNFVKEPNRSAFIDSRLIGIPFQGYDRFIGGEGSMKGVLGKAVTLFNQRGIEMDQSSLVTVLSECLVVPSIGIQPYIQWEPMDETHAKAQLTYKGMTVGGVFTFNEKGEMLQFTTNDRTAAGFDGNMEQVPWSAICEAYVEVNGIKRPTTFRAVWHYPNGDHVYFDCKDVNMDFYFK